MSDALSHLSAALADRYRLERELGAGGMATVYLAEDLRHHRKVALKVLRPELAAVIGAERFLAEIRTTANLQHPHILPLFDSGHLTSVPPLRGAERGAGGEVLFYVMPYIEGESLRDRLTREKQLPVDDAVRIAREVAAALDYAHRRGVVHRDIKPENILLHDGQALVADFGIALALSTAGGSRMTETGMSLGTPHYMSPEQAMGEREITARSDVYALGCVLYEMLLGEPPFTGPTAQAIVAKVMTEKPAPITARRERVSPAVEEAVLTALEKLPADRFASAAEFAQALSREHPTGVRAAGGGARARSRAALALAAAVGVVALGTGYVAGRAAGMRAAPQPPPSRLAILAPAVGGSGAPALHRQLTLTPDGTTVIYVAVLPNGQNQLMRQRLEDPEPAPIVGSAGLAGPQVTPDGQWLVAHSPTSNSSVRLPISGGTPVTLPAGVVSTWGAFDPDGSLWFWPLAGLDGTGELAPDGRLEFHFTGNGNRIQQVLPDGHTALVIRSPVGTNAGPGVLLDLRTGQDTVLVDVPLVEMHYTAGYLLVVRPDGSLDAAPFDARRNRLTGAFAPIATGVSVTGTGVAHLAVAPNGTVAYLPEAPRSLVLVDRSGSARPATEARHNFHAPAFAPDGRRISVDLTAAGGRDVWILALDQGTLTRVTFDGDGHDARWAPDGRSIIYTSARSGGFAIYRTRPGSGTPAESLLADAQLTFSGIWRPDGSGLVATATNTRPGTGPDIVAIGQGGRGPVEPIVNTPFIEHYPALSPDGRWLAFVSNQSGREEVYVRPLDGQGDLVQVSREGGTEPMWGPDGREVFYLSTQDQVNLMAATLHTAPTVEVLARRALFSAADYVGTNPHANYDVSPDGSTFAMVSRSPATRVVVIQNLPELVRRLSRGQAGGR